MREVISGDMDVPVVVETYTIGQAAEALGKSELTLKNWINDDLLPEPVLRDTVRSYRHYSVGELTVIARELAVHEETEGSHYTPRHTYTRERLMQAVHAWRVLYI
jgi:hypothetical protein